MRSGSYGRGNDSLAEINEDSRSTIGRRRARSLRCARGLRTTNGQSWFHQTLWGGGNALLLSPPHFISLSLPRAQARFVPSHTFKVGHGLIRGALQPREYTQLYVCIDKPLSRYGACTGFEDKNTCVLCANFFFFQFCFIRGKYIKNKCFPCSRRTFSAIFYTLEGYL